MFKALCVIVLLAPWSLQVARAAHPLDLAVKGDVILDEPLPIKGQKSKFAHGITKVLEGGGINGRTDPSYEGHGAGLGVSIDHGNAIYQFEVKIEGDVAAGFIVGGHGGSCSFKISSDHIWIGSKTLDADKTPVTLADDKWHVVTVTRVGNLGSIRIGDVVVKGEEPTLPPEVSAIRFHVKGDPEGGVSYRNLKIWKAVPAQ
jgi:hypothetical protein